MITSHDGLAQESVSRRHKIPSLGPSQLLIRVSSTWCSCGQSAHGDTTACLGDSAAVCGSVVGLGTQVSPWMAAKRVIGSPDTSYRMGADMAILDIDEALLLPSNVNDTSAFALTNDHICAWLALTRRAGVRKGETILISDIGNPVSAAMIQIAKILGVGTIVATTNENSAQLAEKLGADRILRGHDTELLPVTEDLRDYIDTVVIDASQGNHSQSLAAYAAPEGRLIVLHGGEDTSSWNGIISFAISKQLAVLPLAPNTLTTHHRDSRNRAYRDLLNVIAQNRFPPISPQSRSRDRRSLITNRRKI